MTETTGLISKRWRTLARDYGPIAFIYIAVALFTRPDFFSDTWGYVQSVLKFDNGGFVPQENPLWEFGHLYWRPLAWALFKIFGWMTPYLRSAEPNLAVTVVFVGISVVAGFVCILLIQSLALRASRRLWVANTVSCALLCFYAFLNYDKTGHAYVTGLMFETLALWLSIRAVDRELTGWRNAILPGAMAACAVLMWFPYILTLPGLLAAIFLWRSGWRRYMPFAVALLCVAVLVIAIGYLIAIIQLHITSAGALLAWISDSSHGWSQTQRLVRMATGLPRSFLSMRDDGMMLKRYHFKDPYVHVTLMQLVTYHVWKLAAFYVFVATLIWILWRANRSILAILAAACAPVILFAVFIFESGSPERYLPLYPFLAIAMAVALSGSVARRSAKLVIIGFVALAVILNLTALSAPMIEASTARSVARARSLNGKVNRQGLIALLTFNDELYQLAMSHPFNPVTRTQELPVYDVIEPGNMRVTVWKQQFAERSLTAFQRGGAVWVSKRLFAAVPDPSWRWTEGDDPRIAWRDVAPFFNTLTYTEDTGGPDGFFSLAPSAENKVLLDRLIKTPSPTQP